MTFDDILEQAIELLRRRGRLTYRALKRQFDLDDGYLDDLKEELIYGQKLAVDEDERVLVWTGDPAATQGCRTARCWTARGRFWRSCAAAPRSRTARASSSTISTG